MAGVDAQGRTPLHYAALADDTAAVRTLLSQGADPNVTDRLGLTAQHSPRSRGPSRRPRPCSPPVPRWTPSTATGTPRLFTAVFNSRGRGELIKLLRHHGADPWHPNNTGQTPIGLARLIANYNVAQFFADLTDPKPKT